MIVHPSHKTRTSDASSFDEICVKCGHTDRQGNKMLTLPCRGKPQGADLHCAQKLMRRYSFNEGGLVHVTDGRVCGGEFCGELSPLVEDALLDTCLTPVPVETISPSPQDKWDRNFLAPQDKWDRNFLGLAQHIAGWSKDKSRKVACVIIREDNRSILSYGYNGFPRGVNDDVPERHERPEKYLWTEHAERNAIYNAANNGVSLIGSTIYLPWYPCIDCARAIVQSGISAVVCVEPDWDDPKYGKEFCTARVLFEEARTVNCRFVAGIEPPRQQ